MKFGKIHAVEFQPGELFNAVEIGNGVAVLLANVDDFCRQVGEVGEEIAELLNGIQAFAAAIISHEQVSDGGKVLRDDEYRAFGVVEGFTQIVVGLFIIDIGIKEFPADQDEIGKPAFLDEQFLIPFAIIVMEGVGNIILLALAAELVLMMGDHFLFIVFQFHDGDGAGASIGCCEGGIVDWPEEKPLRMDAFILLHGMEEGKRALGEMVASPDNKYLFHIMLFM